MVLRQSVSCFEEQEEEVRHGPRNRSLTQAHDGQGIVGIKKDLQNVPSLPLAGSTYTMAALAALVQTASMPPTPSSTREPNGSTRRRRTRR